MDDKLLNALNNLSDALTEIADIMSKKPSDKDSDVTKALVEGGITEQLNGINEGIKSIKDDTGKILSNQQTIMNMAKSSGGKDDIAAKVGGDKNKQSMIKDGLGTIMLMAVAIVALGAAFNLISGVDFGSVVALGIVIPVLALSFVEFQKKIQEIDFDPVKDGLKFIMTTASISLAILASSYILGMVQPIGIASLATAVLIAGTFAAIGFSLKNIISGFKDVSLKDALSASLLMPLVLPAMSLAIAASSYILGSVQPVGLTQLFSALAVSLLFVPLGFAAGMLLESFKDIKPETAFTAMATIPIVMIGMSVAIMASSHILGQISDVSITQFITALAISVLFIPLAFAAGMLIKMTKDISAEDMIMVPITMVLMSGAIMLSSHILSESAEIPFGKLFNILATGITIAAVGVVLGGAMVLMNKMGKTTDYLMGGLATLIVAGTIMVSSHILALGDYGNYPDLDWSKGVGLSMLTFGLSTLAFGIAILATGGLGLLAIGAGAAASLVVAGAIVGTSKILSEGNYGNGPSLEWATSTALLLAAFAPAVVLLGTLSAIPFVGGAILEAGSEAVLGIAQTIVDASSILSTGNFTGGPTKEWAEGIAIALGAFSPIYEMLLLSGAMTAIFGGGVTPDDFSAAIKTITEGIVDSAGLLNKTDGTWTGGPTKEWAEGVALSIGAFSKVYEVLAANSGWFSSGVSVDDMASAIETITKGIIKSAQTFNEAGKDPNFWTGGPTKEWSEGISGAITGFVPIYDAIIDDVDNIDVMNEGMLSITDSIIKIAKRFSDNPDIWNTYPPKEWAEGIKNSIQGFADIMNDDKIDLSAFEGGIISDSPIDKVAEGMYNMADAYYRLGESITKFNTSLDGMNLEKVNAFRMLTNNIAVLSAMDSEMFSDMLDTLEERSGVFAEMLKLQYEQDQSRVSVGDTTIAKSTEPTPLEKQNMELIERMEAVIGLLASINNNSSNIDEQLMSKIDKPKELI